MEVNQPVVRTVGNISTAIAQSEFGNSVHRSVQVSPDQARPARGVYSNQESMLSGFIIFAFILFGLEIRLDWNKIAGK